MSENKLNYHKEMNQLCFYEFIDIYIITKKV